MSQVVGLLNKSYKPITNTAWVRARLCKLQKGCIRLAAASDQAYPLLAHGRWFSLGTPASATTKIGRHDIAEIMLKVALSTINQIKSFCNRPCKRHWQSDRNYFLSFSFLSWSTIITLHIDITSGLLYLQIIGTCS